MILFKFGNCNLSIALILSEIGFILKAAVFFFLTRLFYYQQIPFNKSVYLILAIFSFLFIL